MAETPLPVAAVEAEAEAEVVGRTSKAKPAPAAKPAAKPGGDLVMGVKLSNPDKVLWPAADGEPAATKRDLALYYEAMADAIMPHIKGRPCSIIRCPDGVSGPGFFQRHIGQGSSALVTGVSVWGDEKPYLQIDRPEALAAMAQTGALELHPWNCLPDEPETPGRLVFDLEPAPGVSFEMVIEGALEIRKRLEALGMVAFCKTTGGKGLHVVTPLKDGKGKTDWKAAKQFAHDVSVAIAADAPDRYVVNMAKAKRKGRIFLDYLRNDRMATAVGPLSPRARPGAPVSFPLTWSQVKKGLDPKKWTIRTAPSLLTKTKAWEDYCEAERPLAEAIRKLGR